MKQIILLEKHSKMLLTLPNGWNRDEWLSHLHKFLNGGDVDRELFNLFEDICDRMEHPDEVRKISAQIFNIVNKQGELFYGSGSPIELAEQETSDRLWFANKVCEFNPKDGTQSEQNRRTKNKITKPPSLSNCIARYINSERYWRKRRATTKPKIVLLSLDEQKDGNSRLDNLPAPTFHSYNPFLELLDNNHTYQLLSEKFVRRTEPTLFYNKFLKLMIDPSLPENLTDKIGVIAEIHGVKKAALTAHVYTHFYPFLRNLLS
jgi:hypothetical protein